MFARLALETDKAALRDLGLAHVAEITPHLTWSEERAAVTFERYLSQGNPTFFVVEDAREVIGYVTGVITEYAFTSGFSVALDVIYVRPDKRGSRASALLLKAFNQWADRLRPDDIVTVMSNARVSRSMPAFLRRHGFAETGRAFVKQIGDKP